MIKEKKGFTLVELLGVIIVLGVIFIIAIPKITDSIQNAKAIAFDKQKKIMLNEAKRYIQINKDKDGVKNDGIVSYGYLIDNGILKDGIKDNNGNYLDRNTLIDTKNKKIGILNKNQELNNPSNRLTSNFYNVPLNKYRIYGNSTTTDGVTTSLGENGKNLFSVQSFLDTVTTPEIFYDEATKGLIISTKQNLAQYNGLDINTKENTQYTFSCKFRWVESLNSNTMVSVFFIYSDGTYNNAGFRNSKNTGEQTLIFTSLSGKTLESVVFSGWSYNGIIKIYDIQLEENSSSTEYRPYRYIDVVSRGKNLFNMNSTSKNNNGIIRNGVLQEDGSYHIKPTLLHIFSDNTTLPLENASQEQVTITLKAKMYSTGTGDYYRIGFRYTDGTYSLSDSKTSTDYEIITLTSLEGKIIQGIGFDYKGGGSTVWVEVLYLQVEYGTTATSYEPYVSSTTTLDLTGHDPLRSLGEIKDYIEYPTNKLIRKIGINGNGELYELPTPIEKEIILPPIPTFNGTTNISVSGGGTISTYIYNNQ